MEEEKGKKEKRENGNEIKKDRRKQREGAEGQSPGGLWTLQDRREQLRPRSQRSPLLPQPGGGGAGWDTPPPTAARGCAGACPCQGLFSPAKAAPLGGSQPRLLGPGFWGAQTTGLGWAGLLRWPVRCHPTLFRLLPWPLSPSAPWPAEREEVMPPQLHPSQGSAIHLEVLFGVMCGVWDNNCPSREGRGCQGGIRAGLGVLPSTAGGVSSCPWSTHNYPTAGNEASVPDTKCCGREMSRILIRQHLEVLLCPGAEPPPSQPCRGLRGRMSRAGQGSAMEMWDRSPSSAPSTPQPGRGCPAPQLLPSA